MIVRPTSITEFLSRGRGFLARHEAEHGLMLGVAGATPKPSADAYLALVLDGDTPVAAAMRLDWRLILSRADTPTAIRLLAADAASPLLGAVLGPSPSVEEFTSHSDGWRTVMNQGIYECRAVTLPAAVDGARREATPDDRELLAHWLRGFIAEALHEQVSEGDALARIDGHIAAGHLHVWDVGSSIVSLSAAVAPTIQGIRINHVYTPPEFRGRGYASTLVASLTQSLLDGGYRFTFLHSDLANPISNRIYQRIGYQQVATFAMANRSRS